MPVRITVQSVCVLNLPLTCIAGHCRNSQVYFFLLAPFAQFQPEMMCHLSEVGSMKIFFSDEFVWYLATCQTIFILTEFRNF